MTPLRQLSRRMVFQLFLLAGIGALLVLATAFAASAKLRSPAAARLATGTTVRSPLVLGSVDFLNSHLGFVALGNTRTHHGYLYKTTDGGRTWSLSTTYRTSGLVPTDMGLLGTKLEFLNPDVGFLYAAFGSPFSTKPGVHIHGMLQRTVNGGRSWTRVKLPTKFWQDSVSMSFVNRHTGWVMISSGTTMGQAGAIVYRTDSEGRSWRQQAEANWGSHGEISIGGLDMVGSKDSIHFTSARYGWIFGEDGAPGYATDYVTTDGGRQWKACIGTRGPFARGAHVHPCAPVPPRWMYPKTTNGLQGQVLVSQLDSGDFFGRTGLLPVAEQAPSGRAHGSKPGKHGYFMYHLNRSRNKWALPQLLHPLIPIGGLPPSSIGGTAPSVDIESARAWVFQGVHKIVDTTNAGQSWRARPSPLPKDFSPGGIKFFGSKVGFVWGGMVNGNGGYSLRSVLDRTDNGGKTWTTVKLPVNPDRTSIASYTAKTAFAFTPTAASPNAVPQSQAVSTARQYAQALPPPKQVPSDVTESVYYGNYADQSFVSRPVWLVEYTGPGVNICCGPHGALGPRTIQVDHAEAVVVDAFTGQFLTEITTEPAFMPVVTTAPISSIHASAFSHDRLQLGWQSTKAVIHSAVGTTVDLSSFAPFDFSFTPQPPGQASVSQEQAVTTALRYSIGAGDLAGNVLPGVTVNAQYGLFTDNKMTSEPNGSDQQTLLYQQVPVWIVTFTGATVGGPGDGPRRAKGGPPRQPETSTTGVNTEAVVINATSGAAMLTFD